MSQLKDQPVTKTIDVKGQICPYPLIRTRQELQNLKAGEILEIITDNESTAKETVPRLCSQKKYDFQRVDEVPGVWRLYIKKTS